MRALLSRLLLAILAAAIGVGLLLYGNHNLKNYFSNTEQTRSKLHSLQTDFYALESEILRNSSFLYYSYDRVHHLSREIRQLLKSLETSPQFQKREYQHSRRLLREFSRAFDAYLDELDHFLTLNASLKNSAIYLPTLQLRSFSIFDSSLPADRETLFLISRINASIFLAKNAQDPDFLSEIAGSVKEIEQLIGKFDGPRKQLLSTLREHLDQFIVAFPPYTRSFQQLLDNKLAKELSSLFKTFQKEAGRELAHINQISQWLLLLYLLSIVVITYLIFKAYQENRRLRRLKRELEHSLLTDALTGLGNRIAYRKRKTAMKDPVLILLNIDRFKHVNEFFGTQIGDAVLHEVSCKLKKITPESLGAKFYRMGGDDFGILFERSKASISLEKLLESYHGKLEGLHIEVDDLLIDLSFTLGASDRKEWLFETADMALKAAKSSPRKRYALYTPALDKREEIAQNIQVLRTIRSAIEHRALLPYFQPLYDLKEHRIQKFEALARIEREGGQGTLQPYSFIEAATEAKLSSEITQKIFEETLKMADQHPYDFSVNIAATDITDHESRERILRLLRQYRHLARRICFEMLESEEIHDYEAAADFIRQVKSYGCRVAIDDFGSGYSNFEKLLQLDIDIIKVDGSLIRRIDQDSHAELVVRTILDFARHAGWQTVAEFVHSQAVYEKVVAMGFNYAQGYYIAEPRRELQTEPDFAKAENR
jgi:diguanylate cyclase (GGDEF)-like protein